MRNFSPILPLGRINLSTGSSKYFNIYDTWGESTTYEIYEVFGKRRKNGKPFYRIVATAGKSPLSNIGSENGFCHDQTGAFLFTGKMVDCATGTNLKKKAEKYGNSIAGATYK